MTFSIFHFPFFICHLVLSRIDRLLVEGNRRKLDDKWKMENDRWKMITVWASLVAAASWAAPSYQPRLVQ